MILPKNIDIDLIRGQALDILVTVPDDVDLVNAVASFGISRSPLLGYDKMLPVNILGQVITANLSGQDCAELIEQKYYYSCWIVIASDPTPIARGSLKIKPDSRNN